MVSNRTFRRCSQHTQRGSLAGTIFAGIVYASCFAKTPFGILSLRVDNLIPTVHDPHGNPFELLPVVFHDDTAIFNVNDHCKNIIPATIDITKNCNCFCAFGLQLNLSAGKSECVALPHGPGTKYFALKLQDHEHLSHFHVNDIQYSLLFTDSYKHMGSRFSARCGIAQEVAIRAAVIGSGINMFSRILKNPSVSPSIKIKVVRIYLMSAGLFQCSTWPELSNTSMLKFHSALLRAYRIATNNVFNPANLATPMSDQEIIDQYSLDSPTALIRRMRIQLFARIHIKRPAVLINLIHLCADYPKGWCAALKSDLFIISTLDPDLSDICIKDFSFAESEQAKIVCRKIIKCARSPYSNLDVVPCKPKPVVVGPSIHKCPRCSYQTNTTQQINLHKFKCYGWKDPYIYIYGSFHP